MEISITINDVINLRAVLNETDTAQTIYRALPLNAKGDTWGEEIYFASGVNASLIDPTEILDAGDLAYWPPMQAICIFYGPTPASLGNEIRAAGPVSVFGKIHEGDLKALKSLRGPVNITLKKA
ncbi:MAG: cyclophilin-like fold protein [Bacillota bacterium]